MGPYSNDLRERIVAAYDRGEGTVREIAAQFAVDPSTVQRYRTLARRTGSVAPKPHAGGPERILRGAALRVLQRLRAEKNDRIDREYADALLRETGLRVSRRTVCQRWARLRITRKKKRPARHRA